MHPLQLPTIKALWARLVDAKRHGLRFPLLAALLILGSAWLFLEVLEDVATGDPLVDVDVIAAARLLIAATTALCIALIALSRLYLGVHWASDVIAGASFGLAWTGALAMAYSYRTDDDVKPNQLADRGGGHAAGERLLAHHAKPRPRFGALCAAVHPG